MLTAHMELIDGQEIPKPLTKKNHARIQQYLIVHLATILPREYQALPELNVLCGADRLVPDVTVVRRRAVYDNGDLSEPAILAIEIGSPKQTFSNLIDKCERLLAAGTPACWIILPDTRKAWMVNDHTSINLSLAVGELWMAQLGIKVNLDEMWAELDD